MNHTFKSSQRKYTVVNVNDKEWVGYLAGFRLLIYEDLQTSTENLILCTVHKHKTFSSCAYKAKCSKYRHNRKQTWVATIQAMVGDSIRPSSSDGHISFWQFQFPQVETVMAPGTGFLQPIYKMSTEPAYTQPQPLRTFLEQAAHGSCTYLLPSNK